MDDAGAQEPDLTVFRSTDMNIKRVFSLIIAVMIIFGVAGCVPNTTRNIERAKLCITHQAYDRAITELKAAAEVSPENPTTQYWLGFCYDKEGQPEKALYHFGLAVKYGPHVEVAQLAYIRSLYQDNQQQQSLDALERYLKYRQAAARDFQRLAKVFLARQMFAHADISIEAARRVEPQNPRPLIMMFEYFEAKGDTQKASEYLKLILSSDMNMTLDDKIKWAKKAAHYGISVEVQQVAPPVKVRQPRKELSPLEKDLKERGL